MNVTECINTIENVKFVLTRLKNLFAFFYFILNWRRYGFPGLRRSFFFWNVSVFIFFASACFHSSSLHFLNYIWLVFPSLSLSWALKWRQSMLKWRGAVVMKNRSEGCLVWSISWWNGNDARSKMEVVRMRWNESQLVRLMGRSSLIYSCFGVTS